MSQKDLAGLAFAPIADNLEVLNAQIRHQTKILEKLRSVLKMNPELPDEQLVPWAKSVMKQLKYAQRKGWAQ